MGNRIPWSRTSGGNSVASFGTTSLRVECDSEREGEVEWTVSGFAASRASAQKKAEKAALAVPGDEILDAEVAALMVAAQEGRAYLVVDGTRDFNSLFTLLRRSVLPQK